ncbi:MAG: hypothetical protein JWO94_606 [Verrucomicrobiaceae bacterium]|nr:hypothetical protein [Verrucomicrobiaceae bacterium]
MNWLAHLFLSEPSSAFRIGNLLPDLLPPAEVAGLPLDFRRGAECHRRIDAFTDSHPIVRRSKTRISPAFRRFSGILTDMFYDHVLARDWQYYSSIPLAEFVAGVHLSFDHHRQDLPTAAYTELQHMRAGDWLNSYGEMSGLRTATECIGMRFRRPVNLTGGVAELEFHYQPLCADFAEFFPELMAYVAATGT